MSSLSYGEGVAAAVYLSGADMEARGAADRAEYSARAAADREQDALTRLQKMTQYRNEWRDEFYKMGEIKVRTSRQASVGLIFMNAFKQVLETMPADQADKLLAEVRSLTQQRINYLDAKEAMEASQQGLRHISIQSELQLLPQYTELGFDK